MTDREMLELAARAAGIALEWSDAEQPGYYGAWRGLPQWEDWNPLTDDGDRYRLAQKLRINIDFADCCAWYRSPLHGLMQEFWGEDCPDEAHAIVMVAATIGKALA